jgi:WhiB family redox-sensing transcriptional regulator
MTLDAEIAAAIAKLQSIYLQSANRWRGFAACSEEPLNTFFEPEKEARAKSICAVCPVRVECLDDAIKWSDMDCVRGGLNDEERIKVVFHRKRYQSAFQASIGNALNVREDKSEDSLRIL